MGRRRHGEGRGGAAMSPLRSQYVFCGRPDDAFTSQIAMFRLALDALGSPYREARIAMSLDEFNPIPARWDRWVDGVQFAYAPHDHIDYVVNGKEMYANTRLHSYSLIDPSMDICFVCAADTLQMREFDASFLSELVSSPFIGGVTAHFPPTRDDSTGHAYWDMSLGEFWNMLGRRAISRDVPLTCVHSLGDPPVACPFY